MKKNVNDVRKSVEESISSIFTKEDVMKLIDSIEVSESSKVSFDEDFVDFTLDEDFTFEEFLVCTFLCNFFMLRVCSLTFFATSKLFTP